MTADDKRAYLKSKGWRRADRACSPGKSREVWYSPHPRRNGMSDLGRGLGPAYRMQLKIEGRIE